MRTIIIYGLLLFFFVGCVVNPQINHIISIDKKGRPTHPQTDKPFDEETNAYNDHIDAVLSTDKDKIIIYIHGGLNRPSSTKKRVNILAPAMIADRYHPIFINWRSFFFTTYGEHLFNHRQGEHWTFFGYVTSPFILITDLARGISRTPMVWWYKTGSYAKANIFGKYPSEDNALKITNIMHENNAPFGETPKLVDGRSKLDKLGHGILGGVELGLGLVTAPVFDAIGTGSWDVMKRRTEIMFTKSKPSDGEVYHDLETYTARREGALVAFFNKLEEKQRINPNLEIVIIGHSMGAIVANNILVRWPKIKYTRIIYMAAACSIKDFQLSVIPYLKEHTTKFYNHTLHPIAENLESHGYGFGGTGTLLNQIDNFYEDPVAENQRVLGKWVNVMNGINYFDVDGIQSRIYLRTMPFDENYPTKHSDFGNPKYFKVGKFWNENFGKEIVE